MVIHRPKDAKEATALRHSIANSAYLAGGTEVLRLGSSVESSAELIDINNLGFNDIYAKDGKLYIGSGVTFQDLKDSPIVPDFIRESAGFCTSFQRRNAATIGGNIATKRSDSYLLPSLLSANATLLIECEKGEVEKTLLEYIGKSDCKAVIKYIIIPEGRKGWARRISRSSSSHSTLIASHSEDLYSLSVSGSKVAVGTSPDIYKDILYVDDLEGSADYKRYLSSVIFGLEGK